MSNEKFMCPMKFLSDRFGGKWKLPIICALSNKKPHRFSAIKRKLRYITSTTLSITLKGLEAQGLVERTEFDEIIPHVEYALTKKGVRVLPMLVNMVEWAAQEMGYEDIHTYCDECMKIS